MGSSTTNKLTEDYENHKREVEEKLSPLSEEIGLIQNASTRSFVRAILAYADLFWTAPAAWTPDVNPPDEHEENGLVLHTKRAIRVAKLLCLAYGFNRDETDLVLSAVLLHGVTKAKLGEGQETELDDMYPYRIDQFIAAVSRQDQIWGYDSETTILQVDEEVVLDIARMIRCQLGNWSSIPETIPLNATEMVVHISILVAAHLHFIIDGEEIDITRWHS